jgi:hypothetical protein
MNVLKVKIDVSLLKPFTLLSYLDILCPLGYGPQSTISVAQRMGHAVWGTALISHIPRVTQAVVVSYNDFAPSSRCRSIDLSVVSSGRIKHTQACKATPLLVHFLSTVIIFHESTMYTTP